MTRSDPNALCTATVEALAQERLTQGLPLPFPDKDPNGMFGPSDPRDRSFEQEWRRFRALANTRLPCPASDALLRTQDLLLRCVIERRGTTTVDAIAPSTADPRISIWRGDITTLAADAIVNAANSGMTGCWSPLHSCIDNAIHTFAGIQLRIECAAYMQQAGRPEPTGHAVVTGAYNLPPRHVIHTVGPIANGRPTALHREQLADCYRACLDAAATAGDASIAFCCISTGIFGFPQAEACAIATRTVRGWLDDHASRTTPFVIFAVFTDTDEELYHAALDR